MSEQQELHEMIAEKRRLEAIALAADSAVLLQSIAIWKRFGIYVGVDLADTGRTKDRVLSVFNGEWLPKSKVKVMVTKKFPAITPKAVDTMLRRLSKDGPLERSGRPHHYQFRKVHK